MYLPLPRPEGKLCFMELTEAVAASLPRLLAIGDSIETATWGQFVVADEYSRHWLNDYGLYFATICDSSWDRAVALHLQDRPLPRKFPSHRCVTKYLCTGWSWWRGADVQYPRAACDDFDRYRAWQAHDILRKGEGWKEGENWSWRCLECTRKSQCQLW